MRNFLADLALRCARNEMGFISSGWWHDVASWLDGLGSWAELRAARRRRSDRTRRRTRIEVKAPGWQQTIGGAF